ncbi:MAG: phosphomannomutase/phosphoglucomutase [Candidatus Hydrogenedentota bacterium]
MFREYDIRGIAGDDFTESIVETLGKSLAVFMRGKKTHNCIAVGRDGRHTSKALANALIDGLTSAGVNVIDIGRAPTGVTYYASATLKVDCAVQITGSHNPKEYNGMKIALGPSTIHGKDIQKLKEIGERGKFPVAKRPVTITRLNVVPQYQRRVLRDVKLRRRLRVVVDAGNGVGGEVAVPLFESLGCEVIPLYCDVDGDFPNHHPDPTLPETLRVLIKTVKKHGANLGIGLDGDADRIGAVDELGNIIPGDQLLMVLARSVLASNPGATIIGDVKCSRTLFDDVAAHGGKPLMWKTGHSLMKDAMVKHRAQLGGEMSGHIFFKNRWYGFDCAIYAAARLLETLAATRRPFSTYFNDVPKTYATPEIRVDAAEERKFPIVKQATAYFKEELGLRVNTIDGARIEFDDGWGLVRASNTSPVLVMRFEANSAKRLAEIQKLVETKINALNHK